METKYIIINPENSQTLIEDTIDEEDIDYEEARKQLTITNNYYEWSNTIADRILKEIEEAKENAEEEGEEIEKINVDKKMIDEYNEAVEDLNKYGEAEYIDKNQTIEEIEDTIINNNSKI